MVLDGPRVRRNVKKLADYAAKVGIKIRPHTKTHKLRELARMQLDAGANGLTVAKGSEAEVISDPGQDILLAYPPVGAQRAERFAALGRDRTMRAAIDSLAGHRSHVGRGQGGRRNRRPARRSRRRPGPHGRRIAGGHAAARAGDRPRTECAARRAHDLSGHVWAAPDKQAAELKRIDDLVVETLELWARHGLAAPIVSGGSTPTAYQSHLIPHQTEIRPGTYIFNDMNTVRGNYCTLDECAARIIATVVSDAVRGQVVIDAGSKTLAADRCASDPDSGFGHVVEYPDAKITKLSEEHGQVDVTECSKKPAVGERVTVIPNHICPCVNLRDTVWWFEPGEPLRQLAIDARGRIQ